MKAQEFLDQLAQDKIVVCIREAENKTSGEIRVFISRQDIDDPLTAAKAHFVDMGMEKTQERNSVLLLIAPRTHKFAVVGDTAVHARCGEGFWTRLTAEMSGHFQKSNFTEGILHGVKLAGDLLAEHFPRKSDDKNELSDQIATD